MNTKLVSGQPVSSRLHFCMARHIGVHRNRDRPDCGDWTLVRVVGSHLSSGSQRWSGWSLPGSRFSLIFAVWWLLGIVASPTSLAFSVSPHLRASRITRFIPCCTSVQSSRTPAPTGCATIPSIAALLTLRVATTTALWIIAPSRTQSRLSRSVPAWSCVDVGSSQRTRREMMIDPLLSLSSSALSGSSTPSPLGPPETNSRPLPSVDSSHPWNSNEKENTNKTSDKSESVDEWVPSVPYASSNNNKKKNWVFGRDDALFGWIEMQQRAHADPARAACMGHVLDAGTGAHSLRWLATLCTTTNEATSVSSPASTMTLTRFTAITADKNMQRTCQNEVDELEISAYGDVIVGNWFGTTEPSSSSSSSSAAVTHALPTLSPRGTHGTDDQSGHRCFDTILCDYLIGAMDGFSPYRQDEILPLLIDQYLTPEGGRLYVVGLEPLPDHAPTRPSSFSSATDRQIWETQELICDVRRVRDACILLAGHRCYREYPLAWIHRQVEAINQRRPYHGDMDACYDIRVVQSQRFPILYRHETILRQINVGRTKLSYFADSSLAAAMRSNLHNLEQRSRKLTSQLPDGKVSFGFDYVITIEKNKHTATKT